MFCVCFLGLFVKRNTEMKTFSNVWGLLVAFMVMFGQNVMLGLITEIVSELETLNARMDKSMTTYKGMVKALKDVTAKEGATDEEKTKASSDLEASKVEFEAAKAAFKTEMANVKALKDADDLAAEHKALSKTIVPVGGISGDTRLDAQANDEVNNERERCKGFEQFLTDERGIKSLSDNLRTEMSPKSDRFNQGADGLVLPKTLRRMVMGDAFERMFDYSSDVTKWLDDFLQDPAAARANAKAMNDDMVDKASAQIISTGTASNLYQTAFQNTMLEMPTPAPTILGRSTVVPCPTGSIKWPKLTQTDANEFGAVSIAWTTEGAIKDTTTPSWTNVTISTNECAARTAISFTTLRRSGIPLAALVSRLFRGAMVYFLDGYFLTGNGSGQPTGLLNTDQIKTFSRQGSSGLVWQDFVNAKYDLQHYHRDQGTFICHDDGLKAMELAVDSENRPLNIADTSKGLSPLVSGKPYIATDRSTYASDGDLFFGDLREYIVAMEQEIVVKESDHAQFYEDSKAFLVIALAGGQFAQPRAGTISSDHNS